MVLALETRVSLLSALTGACFVAGGARPRGGRWIYLFAFWIHSPAVAFLEFLMGARFDSFDSFGSKIEDWPNDECIAADGVMHGAPPLLLPVFALPSIMEWR